jgi:hypothetical protein
MKVTAPFNRLTTRAMRLGVYLPVGALLRLRAELAGLDRARVERLLDDLIGRGAERLGTPEALDRRDGQRTDLPDGAALHLTDGEASDRRDGRRTDLPNLPEGEALDLTDGGTLDRRDGEHPPPSRRKRRVTPRSSSSALESARVMIPEDPNDLPISSYDSLEASDVEDRLEALTQTDLAQVYGYERAHRDRATVVNAIEARIVALPIPAYDSLKVTEILRRLDALDADELEVLRTYEGRTKNRSTVVSKIESLLK